MRIVFMGSADVSCVVLEALLRGPDFEVVAAVTQPDRPCGRHRRTRPCAGRLAAERLGIEVLSPLKLNRPEVRDRLAQWAPDAIVVVAYGQLLGASILNLPPLGCLNVHLSLLPRHRGAAPVQRAIAAGDRETGVTIMRMDEGMDTGDILMQERVPILAEDTTVSLQERLGRIGAQLLVHCLPEWKRGRIQATPQNHADATLAPKLRKEEGRIDWQRSAVEIERLVRAFVPWPVCYTTMARRRGDALVEERLKVHAARVENRVADGQAPGTVVEIAGEGPLVATGRDGIRLLRVQREGGREVRGCEFVNGCPLAVGQRLG